MFWDVLLAQTLCQASECVPASGHCVAVVTMSGVFSVTLGLCVDTVAGVSGLCDTEM